MNHAVDFVFRKNLFHCGGVAHVGIVKSDFFARNFFHALNAFLAGVNHIVESDNVVTAVKKFHFGMRADVTGSARYQNVFVHYKASLIL